MIFKRGVFPALYELTEMRNCRALLLAAREDSRTEETDMIKEALLRRMEGADEYEAYWSRSGSYETGLATLAQWLEFTRCRGFMVTRQSDLDDRILGHDGGLPYRITNPHAVSGHDVFYVLVWEE